MKTNYKKPLAAAGALLLLVQAVVPLLGMSASAATLTNTFVRFDRMKTSTPTTGTVCAKPVTTDTETGVKVTFPTGYTVSTTTSDWAVSTTNLAWPSGGTAWPGIDVPTGSGDFTISGQTVGFQSGDLTPGTLYCFNWTSSAALSTKSSATADNTGTVATRNTSLDTSLRKIVTCDGTTGSGVITLTNFAAISGPTPAASDYTDTETFVAGGIF
jgi:hypothetical protein